MRMRRARVRTPWPVRWRPTATLTESEFVAWLRELAEDPKWKTPTPWDEHTFRVGVQLELRRVKSQNTEVSDGALSGRINISGTPTAAKKG